MASPRIISLQVGKPQTVAAADGRPMRTSLDKTPAAGPVWLGAEDLDGNYQSSRKYHGGPDKAICCYPSEHYPAVSGFLDRPLSFGAFGENLTLSGVLEDDVCVGDCYRVGDAVVQVSQPRHPCSTLSKKYGSEKLPAFILEKGLTGWYLRTLEEGLIEPADELVLLERPCPRWTITEMNRLMSPGCMDMESIRAASRLPELSEGWRVTFRKRAAESLY